MGFRIRLSNLHYLESSFGFNHVVSVCSLYTNDSLDVSFILRQASSGSVTDKQRLLGSTAEVLLITRPTCFETNVSEYYQLYQPSNIWCLYWDTHPDPLVACQHADLCATEVSNPLRQILKFRPFVKLKLISTS